MARMDIRVKSMHGSLEGFVYDVGYRDQCNFEEYNCYFNRVVLKALITAGFLKGQPTDYFIDGQKTVFSTGWGEDLPVFKLQFD